MQSIIPLEYGKVYHIYNRGINRTIIFKDSENYEYFLRLYYKYIDPVAESLAFCLLPNHFHFLVKIKDPVRVTEPRQGYLNPSQSFSNLFNAYAQAFNKKFKRTGGLFQRPFKRKCVMDENYFSNLIFYIHNNPVKHGICDDLRDYPWSSYNIAVSFGKSKFQKDRIIGMFGGREAFIDFHKKEHSLEEVFNYLLE